MMGAGGYLKARDPAIELVGVQPSDALHGLDGLKHMPTAIVPTIYDPSVPDRQEGVESEEAVEMVRWLARQEGLLAGNSTGAALVAAIRVGTERAEWSQPARIVGIAPDGGGKYLSTSAWS